MYCNIDYISLLKTNIKIQLIPELKMHATFTAVCDMFFRVLYDSFKR